MNAIRSWTTFAGRLCLAGIVLLAATTVRPADSDSYAVRLSRLDDSASRGAWDGYWVGAQTGQTMKPAFAGTYADPNAPAQPGSAYEHAASNPEDCGCSLPACCGCCNKNWYAYVGGLVMGRGAANHYWTTFDQTNVANQLLYFPGAEWGGGVETRIGYWFGCGCGCGDPCGCCNTCHCEGRCGIEAVYWGLWGMGSVASVSDPTHQLGTVQNDGLVGFVNPNDASLWFDNADQVRLRRDDEFHNIEINFLYLPCWSPCNRFTLTAIAGVRYFRFTEGLTWEQFGNPAGIPGGFSNEAITNVDLQNDLVGFQIGSYMNYRLCNRCGIFAVPKVGIYGNHITGHNQMALADGTFATFDASGNQLNFHNSANEFSMLASIDVGFNWAFRPNWSLIGGYRAVAVTGVALGDNQIPQFFADEAQWRLINTNGSLILHGAFTGIEARF